MSLVKDDDGLFAEFLRDKVGNLWIQQIVVTVDDDIRMHYLHRVTNQLLEINYDKLLL